MEKRKELTDFERLVAGIIYDSVEGEASGEIEEFYELAPKQTLYIKAAYELDGYVEDDAHCGGYMCGTDAWVTTYASCVIEEICIMDDETEEEIACPPYDTGLIESEVEAWMM